jgi:glucose/arabinose dehydrogenase
MLAPVQRCDGVNIMKIKLAALLSGAAFFVSPLAQALAAEPDGLVLPPGFHASIVAESIPGIRHLAMRSDGILYASTARGRDPAPPTGIVAIHLDSAHHADKIEHFGTIQDGTGLRFDHGALYASSPSGVYRFTFAKGETIPTAPAQTVLEGMPATGFANRPIAFDGKGNIYVVVGGSGNICAVAPTKGATPIAQQPCPGLDNRGGVWAFKASKTGQKFPGDGVQIVTGLRDMDALDWRPGDGLYGIMHDRNGTHESWPNIVSASDEENIAEEMHRLVKGVNLGWPYTYYDEVRGIRVMAPEYGGNGKTQPPPGLYDTPLVAFHPSHAAPLDMLFYEGHQFPKSYRGGDFVIRHGGSGGSGFDIVFIGFDTKGKPLAPVSFASGFAGATPTQAKANYRPVGATVGLDGSLYVADSKMGRIWRIAYDGKS